MLKLFVLRNKWKSNKKSNNNDVFHFKGRDRRVAWYTTTYVINSSIDGGIISLLGVVWARLRSSRYWDGNHQWLTVMLLVRGSSCTVRSDIYMKAKDRTANKCVFEVIQNRLFICTNVVCQTFKWLKIKYMYSYHNVGV